MITDNEKFIEIQAILASSNINTRDCAKINDLIIELSKENQELKQKYENAVADYETTMVERNELKKQLEEINKMIEKCGFVNIEQVMLNYCGLLSQQKEFIKYMNDIIKDLEMEDVADEELKGYLIQRIDTFKEILQKYKSIIGDDK